MVLLVHQSVPKGTTAVQPLNTAPHYHALVELGYSAKEAAELIIRHRPADPNTAEFVERVLASDPRYTALIEAGHTHDDAIMHLKRPGALEYTPESLVVAVAFGERHSERAHCYCPACRQS